MANEVPPMGKKYLIILTVCKGISHDINLNKLIKRAAYEFKQILE